MPRKLRLEFPGACYHVINRGNYRRDAFLTERTKAAFVDCLFTACARSEAEPKGSCWASPDFSDSNSGEV